MGKNPVQIEKKSDQNKAMILKIGQNCWTASVKLLEKRNSDSASHSTVPALFCGLIINNLLSTLKTRHFTALNIQWAAPF